MLLGCGATTRYRVPLRHNPHAAQARSCIRTCEKLEGAARWQCLERCPGMQVQPGWHCESDDHPPVAWCADRWQPKRQRTADNANSGKPAPPKPGRDVHYNELRVFMGSASTNSAIHAGEQNRGLMSLGIAFLRRDGLRVLGVGDTAQTTLFDEGHEYLGAIAGLALGEDSAVHVELLAELGVHRITGMGEEFLTQSVVSGRTDASLAYGGLQSRLVMDVAGANGLQLELGLQLRGDFKQKRRQLTVDHGGFFEPSMVDTEMWNVGGIAGGLEFGLSYQF